MSAREKLEVIGWTRQEPRSGYDAAVFSVLTAIVDELERLSRLVAGMDETA